ncbi:hypothetical protein GCM10008942_40170 [Rhizomicrobium electricum]|uniref:Tyr recombinase domain-containing protein n=1 Tax=Rhizomicrobium electricum TaxID=480070 RepID=A0ABN1FBT8_9PROT|nr:integrase [Rhizomicrobium electricum]
MRKKVPSELRIIYIGENKGLQLRKSLKTSNKKEAIRLYASAMAEFDREFELKRVEVDQKDHISQVLLTGRLERLTDTEIDALVWSWWQKRAALRQPNIDAFDLRETLDVIEDDLQAVVAPRADEEDPAKSVADQLLIDVGIVARPRKIGAITTVAKSPLVDRTSAQYRYLCDRVRIALEIECKLARDHLKGERSAPADPVFNPASGLPLRSSGASSPRNVGQLLTAYRSEREKEFGTESTARKFGLLFKVIEEVLGRELPVAEIKREHCVEVMAFLRALPPNATKRFRDRPLKAAKETAELDRLPGLAPKTVGTYMQNLAAILNWAEKSGWDVDVNTKGLVRTREAMVKRRGFTPDELSTLFSELSKLRDVRPTRFWVPAIAAYTGARAGEICQLRVEDVVEEQGVWCLNLTMFDARGRRAIDKRLKTRSSERFVPLHPELLSSGLLTFLDTRKNDVRLFPDLKQGPKGNYSHELSKWFAAFLDRLKMKDPCLVFHSFRHGFRDACRDALIAQETAEALGGWTGENQATRYGDRGRVPVLAEAIARIKYGDFRLSAP